MSEEKCPRGLHRWDDISPSGMPNKGVRNRTRPDGKPYIEVYCRACNNERNKIRAKEFRKQNPKVKPNPGMCRKGLHNVTLDDRQCKECARIAERERRKTYHYPMTGQSARLGYRFAIKLACGETTYNAISPVKVRGVLETMYCSKHRNWEKVEKFHQERKPTIDVRESAIPIVSKGSETRLMGRRRGAYEHTLNNGVFGGIGT